MPCLCGHDLEAHGGHTHDAGTAAATHCSRGCGCLAYREASAEHLRAAAHHLLAALPDRALTEAQSRLCEIWSFRKTPTAGGGHA